MRRILVATLFIALGLSLTVLVLVFGRGNTASAAPYIPHDDALVLCSLPPRGRVGVGEGQGELASARKQLALDPTNIALATDFAKRNIEEARATSDPRYLGYAQAALGPWWNEASPPADVLLLRATIRQSVHEFEPALADLNQLLQRAPGDAQAWLTRSVILSVRGEYAASRASCEPLRNLAGDLVSAQCFANVDSLSGHTSDAYASLRTAWERARAASKLQHPAERAWILSSLGEIAIRAGNDAAGEAHFEAALDTDPEGAYARAAYADLLLDEGRPAEAIAWLAPNRENDDNLLLRLAIAEAESQKPEAAAHRETLRARYLASQARGDVVHRREQARFHLVLLHDPAAALELAKANWEVQREPADARIFLESALAAGRVAEALPVIAFLETTGAEEPRLVALRTRARFLLAARSAP